MSSGKKIGLAKALWELRRDNGWTLAVVSARTGIPASTLSKVENGKLSLSYDKLLQLSQGMAVDITRLFSAPGAAQSPAPLLLSNRRSVVRAGEGHFVRTLSYDHHYLATDLLSKMIDPIIADLRASTMDEFGEWVRHPGEEFAYVLEGEVMLHSEIYSPLHLRQGDSIYFDSNMGHAYLAAAEGPCRILSICTSGSEELPEALAEEHVERPNLGDKDRRPRKRVRMKKQA
jgi:transcriptional regulator with XRE-family HTH domain